MSQIVINNNDPGVDVRNALNSMFQEIYATIITPIKIPGVNANTVQTIPFNTFVQSILMAKVAGNPLVRVGLTANGTELCDDVAIDTFQRINMGEYFPGNKDIYFTVSGGSINIRIDIIPNYF